MKRRLISVLMLATILLTLCGPPAAAVDQMQTTAETLSKLGLLNGVGVLPDGQTDFNLDASVTRGEAITMMVRLMGGEQEALQMHYSHPFRDAGWASDYIGYAYRNGLTSGVAPNTFGTTQKIDTAQYLTQILRVLGHGAYADWRNPYPMADLAGLRYSTGQEFTRRDMVLISYSALQCEFSRTGLTLYQLLNAFGVFDPDVIAARPTPRPAPTPTPTPAPKSTPAPAPQPTSAPQTGPITVTSTDQMFAQVLAAMQARMDTVSLQVPAGQEEAYSDALLREMKRFQDVTSLGTMSSPGRGTFQVELTLTDYARIEAYLEKKTSTLSAQDQQTLQAAQKVSASIITSSMGEYDKVKAIHDYLINFNTYQETGSRSHDAISALVDGKSVCDGYAKAFKLLCYLNGIDCVRVCGSAGGGNHAWNKVKVNGAWYNIDVTWDDPVSSRPVLRYDYFLISDSALSKDHHWTQYAHLPTAPNSYTK